MKIIFADFLKVVFKVIFTITMQEALRWKMGGGCKGLVA